MRSIIISIGFLCMMLACQQADSTDKITGRWDVTVKGIDGEYPSWFELQTDSCGALTGRFVSHTGSARPITALNFKDNVLKFSLPPQWEKQEEDMVFEGRLKEGKITGETVDTLKNVVKFNAVKAPELPYRNNITWGDPMELIGTDLSNWQLKYPVGPNGWKIENDILSNTPPSVDLFTAEKFQDFKLHIEFKIPEKGNSGIYLRGRYEIQINDDSKRDPSIHTTGAVYGFLAPGKRVTNPPGEWNSCDITLVGRWVSIELNDQKIIDKKEIPGITGGALDANEGEPGSLMLQGDHRAVEFRNIVITPAISD